MESPSMGLLRRPTTSNIVEDGRFSRPYGPGALRAQSQKPTCGYAATLHTKRHRLMPRSLGRPRHPSTRRVLPRHRLVWAGHRTFSLAGDARSLKADLQAAAEDQAFGTCAGWTPQIIP